MSSMEDENFLCLITIETRNHSFSEKGDSEMLASDEKRFLGDFKLWEYTLTLNVRENSLQNFLLDKSHEMSEMLPIIPSRLRIS